MKKGQLQIQESMLVVMIFTVLLIIGFIIFYRFTIQDVRSNIDSYKDFKYFRLIETIPAMDEFKCSFLGQSKECIDLEKVKAFENLGYDYFKYFGYSNITINVIYPDNNENIQVYINKPQKITETRKISSAISLYDTKLNKYKIGRLNIEIYK